jgi:hypothetical protein
MYLEQTTLCIENITIPKNGWFVLRCFVGIMLKKRKRSIVVVKLELKKTKIFDKQRFSIFLFFPKIKEKKCLQEQH